MGTFVWKRRHGGVLIALVLVLTSVWPATLAGAQELEEARYSDSVLPEEPPPDPGAPAPDPGIAPPDPGTPPPDPGAPPPDPGDGGGGGGDQLPPEAPAEIQAVIDDVAAAPAAAAENDAAAEFLRAVFAKVADLQARFGGAVGPGEVIPFDVLNQIDAELRSFLEPYARQICDNKLVLPGISEEVQAQAGVPLVVPARPALLLRVAVRSQVDLRQPPARRGDRPAVAPLHDRVGALRDVLVEPAAANVPFLRRGEGRLDRVPHRARRSVRHCLADLLGARDADVRPQLT